MPNLPTTDITFGGSYFFQRQPDPDHQVSVSSRYIETPDGSTVYASATPPAAVASV
jgi:hypothetical protein